MVDEIPQGRIELKPYQIKNIELGKEILFKKGGLVLGDEMGLGKTINTVAMITDLVKNDMIRTCAVFSSTAHLEVWRSEIGNYMDVSTPLETVTGDFIPREITNPVTTVRRDDVYLTVVIPSLIRQPTQVKLTDQILFLRQMLPILNPVSNNSNKKHGVLVILSLSSLNPKETTDSEDEDEPGTLLGSLFRQNSIEMVVIDEMHSMSKNNAVHISKLSGVRFRVGLSATVVNNNTKEAIERLVMVDKRFGDPVIIKCAAYLDEYFIRKNSYHRENFEAAAIEAEKRAVIIRNLLKSIMIRNTVEQVAALAIDNYKKNKDTIEDKEVALSIVLPRKHEITIYLLEDSKRMPMYEKVPKDRKNSEKDEFNEYSNTFLRTSCSEDSPKALLLEKMLAVGFLTFRKSLLFTSCAGLLRETKPKKEKESKKKKKATAVEEEVIKQPPTVAQIIKNVEGRTKIKVVASNESDPLTRSKELAEWDENSFEDDQQTMLSQVCMPLTYETGSTGFTVTNIETILKIDPNYLPSTEQQAEARAHRQGQNQEVYVFNFIVKGSVEEFVKRRGEGKLALYNRLGVSINDRRMATNIVPDRYKLEESAKALKKNKEDIEQKEEDIKNQTKQMNSASTENDELDSFKSAHRAESNSEIMDIRGDYERLSREILNWGSLPWTVEIDENETKKRVEKVSKKIEGLEGRLGMFYDVYKRAKLHNDAIESAFSYTIDQLLNNVYDIEYDVYDYGRPDELVYKEVYNNWDNDEMNATILKKLINQ